MPEVAEHAPGALMWADLSTRDPEAAAGFYAELFGWTRFVVPDPDAGGYGMFQSSGRQVAGVGPINTEGMPTAWTTYIGTQSARETADKAVAAGGSVLFGPLEVMAAGSMAIIADPSGAPFGVWQSGEHKGAEIIYEPGSLGWAELNTRSDVEALKPFYKAVFGWEARTSSDGPFPYTEWQLDGASIAGALNMNDVPMIPAEVPPHWLVYFMVSDCDATVATARSAGAHINSEPRNIPDGRFAVITDPQGGVFAIIEMKPH